MLQVVLVLDTIIFVCTFYYLRSWLLSERRNPGRLPYPPGPKGLPLVGNVFNIPSAAELEKARQWAQQYGDLTYFRTLGESYLLVNSYDAAYELFEKRGHNYSSRPQNTLIELCGWNRVVAFLPYGGEHRKSRQMLHRFFGQPAVNDFCELQTRVAHRLLFGLLKEPDTFQELIRHSAGEAIMKVAYGYKVLDRNDPYVELADRAVRNLSEVELFHVINVLPWLRHLPGWIPGTNHKLIERSRLLTRAMMCEPYEMAKGMIHEGFAGPSMTSKLIETNPTADGTIVDEELIVAVTSIAYTAGADTTVSTLVTFCLAMVLSPDIQRRAQEELDRVVGKDNLPTMEDKPNLPYIYAICSESLRWQPVLPFGVPHCSTEDDVYNGYFIPAGTTMLPNVWAMQRDPKVYPNPEKFIPERWLPSDGKVEPLDVRKTAFGFGRRICSGRHFAENTIFITIASILAAFNIEKAVGADGIQITPAIDYTTGLLSHSKPFKCKITPRSNKIALAIQQVVEPAK